MRVPTNTQLQLGVAAERESLTGNTSLK